jgi:hypothetical protein
MRMERTVLCRECGDPFQTDNFMVLFCSEKCKARFEKRVEDYCWFCGWEGVRLERLKDVTVPPKLQGFKTCLQCRFWRKELLGYPLDVQLLNLALRVARKYKLGKGRVNWDEEELSEISHSLRSKIRSSMTLRRTHEERYVFLMQRLNDEKGVRNP